MMKRILCWLIVALGVFTQVFLVKKYKMDSMDYLIAISSLIVVQIGARLDEMLSK